MIIDFLLGFIARILNFVFEPLPRVTEVPEWFADASNYTLPIFQAWYSVAIFATLANVLLIALGVIGVWQVVLLVDWMYNKLRGSG